MKRRPREARLPNKVRLACIANTGGSGSEVQTNCRTHRLSSCRELCEDMVLMLFPSPPAQIC